MKPKAPKKRDPKPNCKTGEVKEDIPLIRYINYKGGWSVVFNEETIKRIYDKFFEDFTL